MFSGTSLGEKGVECIVTTPNGLVRRHLAIRLDAVLQAEQLPDGVTDLDTALAEMDRNTLTHLLCLVPGRKAVSTRVGACTQKRRVAHTTTTTPPHTL